MTDAQKAAKRGAKLLDSMEPKWVKKIDLTKFDLGDERRCVLGQVHGHFLAGLQQIVHNAVFRVLTKHPVLRRLQVATGSGQGPLAELLTLRHLEEIPELDAIYYGFNAETNAAMEACSQQWIKEITKRRKR